MMKREDKINVVQELKKLIASYKTIGILNMSKMPARQFLKIKNQITTDGTKIKMARKGLLVRALNESGKAGIKELAEKLDDSPALIFSNLAPFKLFATLKKNRATSAAKIGAVVTKDVVLPKGPTQIAPGPAITTFAKIGIKTRVEGGKIALIDNKTVLKAGEIVTDDIVAVLSLLKIEPIEIGMNLAVALEDGMIYDCDILDVSTEQYVQDIQSAVRSAINLSLNTDYLTKLTAPLAISLAFWRATSLCIAANVLEKDVIGDLLAKAVAEAKSLESKVPVTPTQAPVEQPATQTEQSQKS